MQMIHRVEHLRKRYTEGKTVELILMMGEDHMPKGLTGTVNFVDDIGQIHVTWDNGLSLALDPSVDQFKLL